MVKSLTVILGTKYTPTSLPWARHGCQTLGGEGGCHLVIIALLLIQNNGAYFKFPCYLIHQIAVPININGLGFARVLSDSWLIFACVLTPERDLCSDIQYTSFDFET